MAEAAASDIRSNYVEWGPVLAGALAASAISFVLLTAGSAIGLSLLSPYPSRSYGAWAAGVAGFWAIFVPILSLLVGGYITGRMRAGWSASPDEVQFRDGVHGLLVWAAAVLISAFMAYLAVATATNIGGELSRAAAADRGALVASAVDALTRPSTGTPSPAPADQPPLAPDSRAELTRILVSATAAGSLATADRDYLARIVASRTGMPPDAAQRRVEDIFADALRAVDTARKAAVAAGLVTATALLLGLAAAWYAAQRGGRHRDQNIPARLTFTLVRRHG